MKTKIFKFFLLALTISGCVVVNSPREATQTEPPPPVATPTPAAINEETALTLKVTSSIKPSFGRAQSAAGQVTANQSGYWISTKSGFMTPHHWNKVRNLSAVNIPPFTTLRLMEKPSLIHWTARRSRLLDVFTQKDILTIVPGFQFANAFFSPDGSLIGVASLDEIKIFEYNVLNGSETGTLSGFSTAAPVYSARFAQDGKHLIWWSRAKAQPMELASGALGPELNHEDFISALSMSMDGKWIATTAGGTLNGEFQPLVRLWDAAAGSVVWEKGNPGYFSSLDFSPDSSLLAAGDDSEVILYNVQTGDEIIRLSTGNAAVNSLGFSPNGATLLTCDADGNVALWKPQ